MFYLTEQRNILDTFFPNSAEFHALLESLGTFFEEEVLPEAKRIDQEELFPRRNLERLSEMGVFAMPFPKEFDGSGLPLPVYVAALEMLAKACANTALHVDIQNMVCEGIKTFGNDYQRNEYLAKQGLVKGRKLIAFALTEPCCGSDARAIRTKAVRSGRTYILNGNKTLITNPGETDFILVFARTEKGISAFIVPRETPGFEVTGNIPKLGFKGNRLSAIRLKDCVVPVEDLLAEEGQGLECAKQMLNSGRLSIAAISIGIAQAAYEKALAHSKKRQAFGENISNLQMIQEKLADMATGINAARLVTYYAAILKDTSADVVSEISQAKLLSSETAVRVCDTAIQIHGGYGYTDGFDVHRHWRDSRMLTIVEGTSDILRLLIAHLELKKV